MPERGFESLNYEQLKNYVPGYDWLPGRFGPPPGIPKAKKMEFDRMTDREYIYAFFKLSQEEKESLMVSEVERRRTFAALWPIESIVKAYDCAKEGFYYTGSADRVQCAFCGGLIRNWERGDIPRDQHRHFFSYCKMVQNKPCQNIPASSLEFSQQLKTRRQGQGASASGGVTTPHDLNIDTVRPKDPLLSVFSRRKRSFQSYPANNNVSADKLCEAGFIYQETGDKVKCFYCDGALETWSKGDDPWTEHAKWYPGCVYVQQTKGLNFIRKARAQMTHEDLDAANVLAYNRGDISFLDLPVDVESEVVPVDQLEGFKLCVALGYDKQVIKDAYHANADAEFEDQAKLMEIVQDLAEGEITSLEKYVKSVEKKKHEEAEDIVPGDSRIKPTRKINVTELVTSQRDPTADDCRDLVNAIRCKKCRRSMAGAVVLPCGCFCLCGDCSRGNLPPKCPACNSLVKGACRTFLC